MLLLGVGLLWVWCTHFSCLCKVMSYFVFILYNLEHKVIFYFSLDQRTDKNRSPVNKWMAPYEWVHKYRIGIFNKVDSVWVTVLKIITKASTAPFASASRNIPLTYTRTLTVWIYSIYGDSVQKHTHTHGSYQWQNSDPLKILFTGI